jgi:hypothetical protein
MMGEVRPICVERRRDAPEQVIRELHEAERLLGEGKATSEVACALEFSQNTYHRLAQSVRGQRSASAGTSRCDWRPTPLK